MITETVFFIQENGLYFGTENRILPLSSASGNDLLWYMKEYGLKKRPHRKNVKKSIITYPNEWQ